MRDFVDTVPQTFWQKKMIIANLINRIEVGTDYELHIDFNIIDLSQFKIKYNFSTQKNRQRHIALTVIYQHFSLNVGEDKGVPYHDRGEPDGHP